jgi:hypothetical protein
MTEDPWDAPRDDAAVGEPGQPGPGPGPLQFGISSLLVLTTVVAALFGGLRWLGISSQAAMILLLLMVVGGIGAVALVWAIAQSADRRNGDDR